jgi:diguanylate cyclase (GGDEF)-like protein
VDILQDLPAPGAALIQPRALASYGALLAAATLGVLYLYRGRPFVVYWIGAWLMLAASLMVATLRAADPRLGAVLLGLAALLVVLSAGLLFLAAESFPANALRWTQPIRLAAAAGVWFLASPFLVPGVVILGSGVIAAGGLVGWSGWEYLQLARRGRYAGALIIACALALICLANLFGAAVMLRAIADPAVLSRVAVINITASIFLSLGMHLLVFEDMTVELRRANQHLEDANEQVRRLAITDPLTGCHNRRFFDEIERRELQRHRRYDSPLSVVFVDVVRFKQLNDALGHEAGDDVLRTIGTLLRRYVRESDYVLRWGGDEFLLLLTCQLREAETKAAELKAAFVRERLSQALPAYVALSIGVAGVSKDSDSLNDAIRDADAAMYRDKINTAGTETAARAIAPRPPSRAPR